MWRSYIHKPRDNVRGSLFCFSSSFSPPVTAWSLFHKRTQIDKKIKEFRMSPILPPSPNLCTSWEGYVAVSRSSHVQSHRVSFLHGVPLLSGQSPPAHGWGRACHPVPSHRSSHHLLPLFDSRASCQKINLPEANLTRKLIIPKIPKMLIFKKIYLKKKYHKVYSSLYCGWDVFNSFWWFLPCFSWLAFISLFS